MGAGNLPCALVSRHVFFRISEERAGYRWDKADLTMIQAIMPGDTTDEGRGSSVSSDSSLSSWSGFGALPGAAAGSCAARAALKMAVALLLALVSLAFSAVGIRAYCWRVVGQWNPGGPSSLQGMMNQVLRTKS